MQERLGLELARHDAGETTSEVNVIASALHEIRMVFDLMPTEGDDARANIAARLNRFAGALESYKRTLRESAAAGRISSQVQLVEVAKQCDIWTDPNGDNFFHGLAGPLGADSALGAELRKGAAAATAATAEFGQFLRSELAPQGRQKQAAGRERYELASQYFLGAKVDLDETYAWGFAELARLEGEMRAVAERIGGSGATVGDAVRALDADPARTIQGKEAFRDWMQALADKAISELARHPLRHPGAGPPDRVRLPPPRPATAAISTPAPSEASPGPGPDVVRHRCPAGRHRLLNLARGDHGPTTRACQGHHLQGRSTEPPSRADLLNRLAAAASGWVVRATVRVGRSTPSG